MAHKQQMDFFESVFSAYSQFLLDPQFMGVVDLGSHDLSGGPNKLIPKSVRYVGVDMAEGDNVDHVSPIELVDLPSSSFSFAISSEVLEHNPYWRETLFQLCRLSASGGLVVWTCAGIGRLEHGTSRSDGGSTAPFLVAMGREYYKNISAREAQAAFNHNLWFAAWQYFENFESRDTYFVGLRHGATIHNLEKFQLLCKSLSSIYVTKKTFRSLVHLTGSPVLLNYYFKVFEVYRRGKRFRQESGKVRKILRRFKL